MNEILGPASIKAASWYIPTEPRQPPGTTFPHDTYVNSLLFRAFRGVTAWVVCSWVTVEWYNMCTKEAQPTTSSGVSLRMLSGTTSRREWSFVSRQADVTRLSGLGCLSPKGSRITGCRCDWPISTSPACICFEIDHYQPPLHHHRHSTMRWSFT